MKHFKMIFLGIVITAFLVACGGNDGQGQQGNDAMHDEATENADTLKHNFAYVCPMHPDQGGDEPGKCAKCGMEYQKNENYKPNGHEHSDHEGHNH